MTQLKQYRVVATCLVTYASTIEAESAEKAGEMAFLQDNPDWSEIGEADWQVDRGEPYVANQPEPLSMGVEVEAKNREAVSELLIRRTSLLKLIAELTETLQSGFLPPQAAQELTTRRYTARTKLKGVETAINKAMEAA